jgi:hypothetical protein
VLSPAGHIAAKLKAKALISTVAVMRGRITDWVMVFIVISWIFGLGSLGIGRSVVQLPHSYRHGPIAKPDIP